MRAVLLGIVLFVVIMGVVMWRKDEIDKECAAKGGETVYTYALHSICVSPDGRIIR